MPKYTLRDMLIGTSLVAVGLFVAVFARSAAFWAYSHTLGAEFYARMAAFFVSGAIIGIGATIPFKKPWIGALLGMTGMYVFLAFEAELISSF